MTLPPPADPTRFVLVNTSHPGNVGSTARAMKVMGFTDLVLVAPRFADVLSREETLAMASGATEVLQRARIVGTLAEALDGVTHACATTIPCVREPLVGRRRRREAYGRGARSRQVRCVAR